MKPFSPEATSKKLLSMSHQDKSVYYVRNSPEHDQVGERRDCRFLKNTIPYNGGCLMSPQLNPGWLPK